MNKRLFMTMGFVMVFGVFVFQANPVLAMEHGGMTMSDDMKSDVTSSDDAATLKDAAAALKSSNPELAKKLEKMASKQCGI